MSGCTAPFPFIPILEARCLCLTEDTTTSLPATLDWSNTWELPLARWEKQQEEFEEEGKVWVSICGVERLIVWESLFSIKSKQWERAMNTFSQNTQEKKEAKLCAAEVMN